MKCTSIVVSGIFCALVLVSTVKADPATIENGKKVKFDYTLKVDGKVFESSIGKKPLEYTAGEGKLVSGLADQMNGLHVGDEKMIIVKAEDGYGQEDPKAFLEVPKSSLPPEIDPKVGLILQVNAPNGDSLPAPISEVKEETVVLNLNHPLSGKELHFDVKIAEITD